MFGKGLKDLIQVEFRNALIVVAVVKVESQLIKHRLVQKKLLDLSLIRFKVNWRFEVYDVLPLLSQNRPVSVLYELSEGWLL